ncbi:copper amine oxidase N-terminal domain-containing protein [Paenibacillus sp. FSL R7-0345]|uniref:copper amine oxidase N-terminal domain-containing protein n=1 Tax=Paenibacillus sp. FSL R7-0345 TaxID=2954535 RepID=UPI00315B0364
MIRKLLLLSTVGLMLLSGSAPGAASAKSSTEEVRYYVTYSSDSGISGSSLGTAIIKNGVSYLPANIVNSLGIEMTWDKTRTRASFSGWEKSFAVRLGSTHGVLDNVSMDIGGTPFLVQDVLYLPAKFLVKALEGGSVRWDAKTRSLLANGLHMYRGYSETYKGTRYSVSLDTGDLYISTGKDSKRKLAHLGRGLDVVDFTFENTPGGLTVLQVRNSYGEPHLYAEYYTYLLKNGALLRQAHTDFHTTFDEPALWSEGRLLLNDGQTLRLIEDGTGAVKETIDLPKLMGTSVTRDVYYNVEAFYPDVALIRPGDTAFLTAVDRSTGTQTLLYEQLPAADSKWILDQWDSMFPGDDLRFEGRNGNELTIRAYNLGPENKNIQFIYTLPAPQ